jgi:hypothetical protein
MAATEQTKESCITGMENLPIDVETYLQKLTSYRRPEFSPQQLKLFGRKFLKLIAPLLPLPSIIIQSLILFLSMKY